MSDILKIFGQEFTGVKGIIATNNNNVNLIYKKDAPAPVTVRFFDYDGSLLHSYTTEEFLSLTAMPENPSHVGLISQGWNWSLADARALVTTYGSCNIGQMYITDDGKTRIYLEMPEGRRSPYLALCPNGTVTVDWGDGSSTDTLTGTSLTTLKYVQHTYPSAGSYVMTLTATSGEFAFYGDSNTPSFLRYTTGSSSDIGYKAKGYINTIQKIKLGEGVRIGQRAFNNCYSLASITIPDSVASIGTYAFSGCYSLASITIPDSVTSISIYAFQYCHSLASITIPDSVTSIGNYAFQNCYSLASITIPDGVTSIEQRAFNSCYSLASITIPDGVTSIGTYAFSGCNSLASITIPDSVTSIGNYAFSDCRSIASITIPDGVTSIGTYAFSGCNSLASITIPDSVTSIGNYAFSDCRSIASITIPDGVTSIGNDAFEYCYSLSSVTIPDGVTSIGGSAFSSCNSLASITIPDGVTSIGSSAFQYCRSLTSITIPDDVTSIGSSAFSSCYGLAEIHFKPTTPPTVANSNAWTDLNTDCIIYVPSGTLSAYKSATNYPSSSTYTYMEESA